MPQFIKFRLPILSLIVAALLVAAIPSPAQAQRAQPRSAILHPVHGPAYRPYYRPYYSYPYYWHSVWWASYGYPWAFPFYGYPYGYGFAYGYPSPYGYYPFDITSAVRLQVTPREAEVFVNGYSAGVVDNFDGVFQRLRVQPGGHEIAIYLDGYRTFRQNIHLSPGSSQTIRHELERLAPGEIMEPRPSPSITPSTTNDNRADAPSPPGSERQYDPRPRQEPPTERERPARPAGEEPRQRFGTLSIRVQPADAEILVDGERWTAPADSSRIAIELAEGRHTVEVRKAGFSVYREDVLIRPGAATNVNVSLTQ